MFDELRNIREKRPGRFHPPADSFGFARAERFMSQD